LARTTEAILEVCAVIEWVKRCKSLGPPPPGEAVRSPDPERPEDMLTTIPMANIDVLYLAYVGSKESTMLIRDFTSF
jgi:hypothetical protein